MKEDQAELYTNPGGKFIREDTCLGYWRTGGPSARHFIKYDGELYADDEIDKLQFLKENQVISGCRIPATSPGRC
jgi:hypothetical protein